MLPRFLFPPPIFVKEIMPCFESECNQKWNGNQLCPGTETIIFSTVSKQQHPVHSILHSAGKRRNTTKEGAIDKLLKYWNLSQLLRLCWHSLLQGRRSLAGERRCPCRDPACKGSSRHSQSPLTLCGTCRTSYVRHLSSPKWSSASG